MTSSRAQSHSAPVDIVSPRKWTPIFVWKQRIKLADNSETGLQRARIFLCDRAADTDGDVMHWLDYGE